MSLLSPDALYIALAPDRVGLMRVRGGLRPRVLARESIAVEAAAAGESWRPALDAMARMLGQQQWQRAPAHVVLSNAFARYRLIPWRTGLRDQQEQHALVRHGFAQVHGERVDQWALRWSVGSASQPAVACAVDQRLLEGIRAVADSASIRLVSSQPYLVAAFNVWRTQLQETTAWLVLAERQQICVALLENGTWKHVAVRALSGRLDEVLPVVLDQESFAAQLPGLAAPVYLHAPAWPGPRRWHETLPVHELTLADDGARFARSRHATQALSLLGDDDA